MHTRIYVVDDKVLAVEVRIRQNWFNLFGEIPPIIHGRMTILEVPSEMLVDVLIALSL